MVSQGGVFKKKLEIEFALLLDSLDPYGSRKNEIRLCWGCLVLFRGASKWHFFILLCKNDPLYIFSKSNEEDRVETLTLTCLTNLANLDIDTYVCDAFFCGNAYFYRNATIKMSKFDQSRKNLFFIHYAHITPVFWAQTDLTQWNHIFHTSRGNSGYIWISLSYSQLETWYELLSKTNL